MKKVYLETPEAVIKALKEGKVIKDDNGYSQGFAEYERRKFCIVSDTDLDGYNLDI